MNNLVEDFESFSKIFPRNFWRAINKQYFDILPADTNRSILKGVHQALSTGSYYPAKPKYYIDKNKGLGVLRRIPVMEPRDYIVYFYCIKKLEEKLAINRAPLTYGGWSLGGLIREKENEELRPLTGSVAIDPTGNPSTPTFSYNESAWAKYYGDYQKKLFATLKEHVENVDNLNESAVQFDIANFYDSVRLNLLEKNVRASCSKSEIPVIDLLFHFIKYWNRDINGYDSQQTGLPQDAFADCSRILANYYLQDYDLALHKYCTDNGGVYFRYADDQIIIMKNRQLAENALHKASLELSKLGLNINKAKVSYHSLSGLVGHFSFSEFKLLHENPNDASVLEKVAHNYLDSGNLAKRNSLLNKILGQNLNLIRHDMRTRIMADAFDKEYITNYCRAYTMLRIHDNLGDEEKQSFLNYLDILANENEYTCFHFELLTFYRQIDRDASAIIERIKLLQVKWN